MSVEDIKALNKNKKAIKKLGKKYDFFLASSSIIRMIPRLTHTHTHIHKHT